MTQNVQNNSSAANGQLNIHQMPDYFTPPWKLGSYTRHKAAQSPEDAKSWAKNKIEETNLVIITVCQNATIVGFKSSLMLFAWISSKPDHQDREQSLPLSPAPHSHGKPCRTGLGQLTLSCTPRLCCPWCQYTPVRSKLSRSSDLGVLKTGVT